MSLRSLSPTVEKPTIGILSRHGDQLRARIVLKLAPSAVHFQQESLEAKLQSVLASQEGPRL